MDWQEKEQEDEQDQEFVALLRQFHPRMPPALKASRRMALAKLLVAAVILLTCTLTLQLLRDKPAAQNLPGVEDVGLAPQSVDAVKPASAAQNVALPSTGSAPISASGASSPRLPADSANNIAPRSTAGAASRAVVAGSPRPGVAAHNGPLRVGGAIQPPRRIVNVTPFYTEEAKAAGIEGTVILQIVIAEDGLVRDALVLQSLPELDQAAINAVLQWQYEPTLLNGTPVEVEMIVYIRFTLH